MLCFDPNQVVKVVHLHYGNMEKCLCLHGDKQSNMNHANFQPLPPYIKP